MQTETKYQKKAAIQSKMNFLLLTLFTSLSIYLIVSFDYFTIYEIFLDILLAITLLGSVGLFAVILAEIIKKKLYPSKATSIALIVLTITYLFLYGSRNGMFWGGKILEGAFIDDRSRMDLALFRNGRYILYSNWLFGEERHEGRYNINGDTIMFDKQPIIGNDIISDQIVIDKSQKKVLFRKDADGKYDESFYYFQIEY